MAAAALLHQPGQRDTQLATVGKSLDYLKSLAKPDGGIYEKMIPHYITAVAVMDGSSRKTPSFGSNSWPST